ncbi:MAG TPA: hypothetical protein VGR28_15130, partial [Candidatus Thermoplasmatota archaeon]|nr:hypothetical protein [Candidatus Thermoplasmatota archaeon]
TGPMNLPKLGAWIGVDLGTPQEERAKIQGVDLDTSTVVLDRALQEAHAAGAYAGLLGGSEVADLASAASAGATSIVVSNPTVFVDATGAAKVGSLVGIDLATPDHEEAKVVSVDLATKTVTLDRPLARAHAAGARAGYEFVHYRWYPDVELGMVYWHDHVAGIRSWTHGLFGGLVVEPELSTWTNPTTGVGLRDGTAATASVPYSDPHTVDIRVPGEPDYREFVAAIQDRNAFRPGGQNANVDPYTSFNLRNAPWDLRRPTNADPAYFFSSVVHGDPSSDLVRAYEGDRTVVRLLYAGQSTSRAVDTFSVSGHRFALERHQAVPHTIAALSLGISSQFNLELECGAGSGYQALAGDPASCTGWHEGDYLYKLNAQDSVNSGAWGIFRVYDKRNTSLLPLPDKALPPGPADSGFPNNVQVRSDYALGVGPLPDPMNVLGTTPLPPSSSGDVGPPGAPVRHYDVAALALPVAYNADGLVKANGAFFAPLEDVPGLVRGALQPEPLVVRANAGEVLEVTLTNLMGLTPVQLASFDVVGFAGKLPTPGVVLAALPADRGSTAAWERVSLAPSLLTVDPLGSGGITVGYDPDMAVAPGTSHTFRWYADRPLGAAYLADLTQLVDNFHAISEAVLPPNSLFSHFQGTGNSAIDEQNAAAHLDRGLYGMAIIEPAGSSYEDPVTGDPLAAGASAVIRNPAGDFREFALLFESQDAQFESSTMPYDPNLVGFTGANYRSEPWGSRLGFMGLHDCNFNTDDCKFATLAGVRNPLIHLAEASAPFGDPATPVFEAFADEPIVFRVAGASGSQLHSFTLEGHAWHLVQGQGTSNVVDTATTGPGEVANAFTVAGGGLKTAADAAGDYLWLDHRGAFEEGGIWGLLRVHDPDDPLDVTLITPL